MKSRCVAGGERFHSTVEVKVGRLGSAGTPGKETEPLFHRASGHNSTKLDRTLAARYSSPLMLVEHSGRDAVVSGGIIFYHPGHVVQPQKEERQKQPEVEGWNCLEPFQ